MVEPSSFDRERALQILEQIRNALTGDNLQEAVKQLEILQNLLVDWRRGQSRAWLDTALGADILLFDGEAANRQLSEWQKVSRADSSGEVEQYQARVQQRIQQRQVELQQRGITAYCEGLWQQAAELERSEQSPHPTFLLTNYYTKARHAAAASYTQHPDNAQLDALLQRAERLLQNRSIAGQIYATAIEKERYGDALDQLEKLDATDPVPRYRVVVDPTAEMLAFDRMITITEARDELERLAFAWAAEQTKTMLSSAEGHLQAYTPQAALDALVNRERVERFVDEKTRLKLRDLEKRANDDLRALEQAERRARQASLLARDNPLGAWDIYVEAYQTYAGAPSLKEAHPAIVSAMTAQLEQYIAEAEDAFGSKDMEHARQICQKVRLGYGDKDVALAALLGRFEELDWQAQSYQEYKRNATQLLEQLRELVWQDVTTAGEILTQLEEYPDTVLEDLPDFGEVRATTRQRLKAEAAYKTLVSLFSADNLPEIEQGIAAANEYAESDARFRHLATGLTLHAAFLKAQQEYATGQLNKALSLLERVATSEGHPDQAEASRLATQIRSELPGN